MEWKRLGLIAVFSWVFTQCTPPIYEPPTAQQSTQNPDWFNTCILYGALYTKYDEVIKNVIEFSNIPGKVKSISGDLLVPASTTTSGIDLANFTALNQDGVSLGGDITIMRNKDKGDNSFWAYYLTHFHKKGIAKYAQVTTIVHLYFSHFKYHLSRDLNHSTDNSPT